MKRINSIVRLIGIALLAAAIGEELRKQPEDRDWHGRIAGFVPYDFRFPTLRRFQHAYWNPENPNVFSDRVLGIGWAINVPALMQRIRDFRQTCLRQTES